MMNERQAQGVALIGEAFAQWKAKIVDVLAAVAEELTESLLPAIQQMYDAIYQAYVASGAIYGETPEGCYRWLEELNKIQALRAEAEYIEMRQWAIADFKHQVALKKAR